MLAFDNLLVNLDSYLGIFSQNYYLYKDSHHRFRPVIWDLNEAFGTFSETGTSDLTTVISRKQMTHLLYASDNNWPLVKNLLAIPTYKRMYLAHMRTILNDHFISNSYYSDAQALQNLISASVSADPNKLYSNSDFINNLTTDINVGIGIAPGLTNLMNGRKTYLSGLTDFTAVQPGISAISVSNSEPAAGSLVNVTARITNTTAAGVFLAYRNIYNTPFVRILMADDGLHGDGAASDRVYGSTITITSGRTEYYFYAENNQAGIFSPQRAGMDFYTINSKPLDNRDLVINEFLASNASTMADQDGEYDDWIELYNCTNGIIALGDLYLSDSYSNLYKWKFPDNTVIFPQSYLIVWADENGSQAGLHANFKLSATGERIALASEAAGIIDSYSFGAQTTDISMMRCPDGTGDFIFAAPTYNGANCIPTLLDHKTGNMELTIYPNPFSDRLYLNSCNENIKTIRIVNIMGQTIFQGKGYNNDNLEINLDQLPKGLYLVIINDVINRKIIKE